MNNFLLYYARRGFGSSLKASAFRKFCRKNRGKSFISSTDFDFRFRTIIGDSVDNQIFVNGIFEPETSNLFTKIAKECRSFVDIGCNIGYFSCLFGKLNPEADIYCIDANPRMVDRTSENMKLNQMEAVYLNYGVSDQKGNLKLFVPKGRHSLSSFAYRPSRGGEIDEITVEVTRLEDLVNLDSLDDVCLKVDTEGFEFNVFNGIEPRHAKKFKYVIFECNKSNIEKAGQSADAIFSIPWIKDFYAFEIKEKGRPAPLQPEKGIFPTNANIFLVNRKLGENKFDELFGNLTG